MNEGNGDKSLLVELREHEHRESTILRDMEDKLRGEIATLNEQVGELRTQLAELQGKLAGYIVAATVAASAFSTIIMFIAQKVLK